MSIPTNQGAIKLEEVVTNDSITSIGATETTDALSTVKQIQQLALDSFFKQGSMLFSTNRVEWTGTQLNFYQNGEVADVHIRILQTESDTLRTVDLTMTGSMVSNTATTFMELPLADQELLYIEIDRATLLASGGTLAIENAVTGGSLVSGQTLKKVSLSSSTGMDQITSLISGGGSSMFIPLAYRNDAGPLQDLMWPLSNERWGLATVNFIGNASPPGLLNAAADQFSGNGINVGPFTLAQEPASANNVDVYISGVYQSKTSYTVVGDQLTFFTAPPTGTNNIEVVTGAALPIGVPSDGAVTEAKLATYAVTTSKIAPSAVNLSKLAAEVLAYLVPTGSVLAYAGTTAPTGFLLCQGQAVSRALYANLFAVIGEAHGEGNNTTTFNIPNYQGRFLRGVDGGSGNDPDAASRTAMTTGGNTGNAVGSVQTDQFRSHAHASGEWYGNGESGSGIGYMGTNYNRNTGSTGGNETRPKNAYVNYIIKI